MYKVVILIGLHIIFLSSLYAQSYIVISPNKKPRITKQKQRISKILASFDHNKSLTITLDKLGKKRFIKVGPFKNERLIAVVYLSIKKKYPYAVILNEVSPKPQIKIKIVPQIKVVEKEVIVTKEVPVVKDDESLWIALFGLATIGILYMFLSSDQIKRLKESQEKVKRKHNKLEEKQHNVLTSMGENIYTIATDTQKKTTKLAERIKEENLHNDVKDVIENESELIDITEDLINFLQLKSKKIIIQNEEFNFNNVLNEVIGTLNEVSKKYQTELIVDIEKNVPYRISADSSHLGKALINLLDYYIQNTLYSYVRLIINTQETLIEENTDLIIDIVSNLTIENKESFFDTSYDEEKKQYIGLGLFVAKELIDLMGGEITIVTENDMDNLHIRIPIKQPNKDRRMYRLSCKETIKNRVMIVDLSYYAALALKKRFEYFRIETTLVESTDIKHVLLHISNIDIVVIDRRLLDQDIMMILKKKKEEYNLKVIALENLYEHYDHPLPPFIDALITKPFSPSYVYEVLEELYGTQQLVDVSDKEIIDTQETTKLLVHKEPFEGKNNFVLSDFNRFSEYRLLLVEDNLINQKVVLNVLAQSNMEILIANNGKEAVDIVNEYGTQIDFILMDINMPVLDGFNATIQIRNNSQFKDIPIVSLTALVAEHEIEKMLNAGMNGYLAKPLKVDKLYTALETFMKPKEYQEINKIKNNENEFNVLDLEEGLSYMKGNKLFYQEVLLEFMDAYATSAMTFESMMNKNKYNEIELLFLDMKGLTGAIGAKNMFSLVSEIHQIMDNKEYKVLKSYIVKYRKELTHLKNAIDSYLNS